MKGYLRTTNALMITLSCIIGIAFYYLPISSPNADTKTLQLAILIPLFFALNFAIEVGALKRIDIPTAIRLHRNPRLRSVFVRLLVLCAGGPLIYVRYTINGVYSQITFCVLTCFFVGAVFQTFRLLRMPTL